MKKVLSVSVLSMSLLLAGGGQAFATTSNVGETSSVNIQNIQSFDVENALMMVQSNRARLVDEQLQAQLATVQNINKQVAILNEQLSSLNKEREKKSINDTVEIDAQIKIIKEQIDTMISNQQMDMVKLQSLSNKRNETFDLMTNFMKKMQENRSSIIGNMR